MLRAANRLPATFIVLLALPTLAEAGYSHHWKWRKDPDPAKLRACIDDMKKLIKATGVKLGDAEGFAEPELYQDRIVFNGWEDAGEACEPFQFPGLPPLTFCKTNGHPYDAVVTACLLVARDHFSEAEFDISSDGNIKAGDWVDGVQLYKKVFGRDPKLGGGAAVGEGRPNGMFGEMRLGGVGIGVLVVAVVLVAACFWKIRMGG